MKKNFALLGVAAILLFILSACGQKDEPTVNTGPFEAAIKEYCKSRSMDMKMASVEKIEVKDNDATAICKMEAAEMPGPKVTWKFTFKQENGKWKAVSQEKK